jgi:carbon-monoxide dehydrogenase small subunit
MSARAVTVTVNGVAHERTVEPRLLLSDFLRHTLGLTGTHVDGAQVETVEGLGTIGRLNALQEAFHEHHALQCGFCTPGMLIAATDLIKKYPLASDGDIREGLSGNLCRCTGYEHIVRAVRAAARKGSAR